MNRGLKRKRRRCDWCPSRVVTGASPMNRGLKQVSVPAKGDNLTRYRSFPDE